MFQRDSVNSGYIFKHNMRGDMQPKQITAVSHIRMVRPNDEHAAVLVIITTIHASLTLGWSY